MQKLAGGLSIALSLLMGYCVAAPAQASGSGSKGTVSTAPGKVAARISKTTTVDEPAPAPSTAGPPPVGAAPVGPGAAPPADPGGASVPAPKPSGKGVEFVYEDELSDHGVDPVPHGRRFIVPGSRPKPRPGTPQPTPTGATPAPAPAPTPADPIVLVQEALVQLDIPEPVPHLGPEPAWNKWNAAAVGFPYWLWTDPVLEPRLSTTVLGSTVRLTAHWESVSFDMGDGHDITCADTIAYVRGVVKPAAPSPVCGYRYRTTGTFTIQAIHHWTIDWEINGQSGQVRMDRDAALAPITVSEFEAVVKA